MKRFFFLSFFASTMLFADVITIDNQTSYLNKNSKTLIGLQWAGSTQEINQKSIQTMYQSDEKSEVPLSKVGSNQINVPSNAKYFRVCVWTNGDPTPEYVTSWVLIVANKNYTLKKQNFYPAVLSSGSGC